mmetsp:Transcript_33176/g.56744  ORF Transcript_33176/g.56744 Transcript_33176/m.56744 type:complete len:205 (-) Transcript_33176:874-1488(-)
MAARYTRALSSGADHGGNRPHQTIRGPLFHARGAGRGLALELLSPLEEALHHVPHVRHDLNAVLVALIIRLVLEDKQLTTSLVQGTLELLIKDHLREFLLHFLHRQVDELRDAVKLNAREWLDDLEEVRLKHVVVKNHEMVRHQHVRREQVLVLGGGSVEILQAPTLRRLSDGRHRLKVLPRVFHPPLGDDPRNLVSLPCQHLA